MSIPSQLPPIVPSTFATGPTPTKAATPTAPAANTSAGSKAGNTGNTSSTTNANAALAADDGDWPDDSALGGNVDTTA